MATQGPNSAGAGATVAGTGDEWSNPSNITASDNSYAFIDAGTESELLAATTFGFDLAASDTIDGFTVEIEANRTAGTAGTISEVYLTKDGTAAAGSNLLGAAHTLTTTDAYYTAGGATALGGTTWTVAEVEASTFGVLVKATRDAANVRIDHIRITVHYTPAAGVPAIARMQTIELGAATAAGLNGALQT